MIYWRGIPVTDGSGQRERMPAAFAPHYFDVDEKSFEQLLAMGAEIAERLRYYNLANEVDGNWGELFYTDEAVVMATILAIDPARMESGFRAIPYNQLPTRINFLLRLARRFDRWYRHLAARDSDQTRLLAQSIKTLIVDRLKTELHYLERIIDGVGIEREVDTGEFTNIWDLTALEQVAPPSPDEDLSPRALKDRLGAGYYVFANAIVYLQQVASEHLQQSLQSQHHDPAVGLFLVFLRLFNKAQERLNRFTSRHLDFYYRRVLESGNRRAEADSYYLLLTRRSGAGRLRIDKGTAFSAGQDEDLNEIVYRADDSLLLSDVEIGSLLTLDLQRNRLISPEADIGFITRVRSGSPSLTVKPAGDSVETAEPEAWPLFGAGAGTTDARLGFVIASPLLWLQQGRRSVEIGFLLEPADSLDIGQRLQLLLESNTREGFRRNFAAWFSLYLLRFKTPVDTDEKNQLLNLAAKHLPRRDAAEIENLLNEDWQGLFYRLFRQPLKLRLTAADGWFEVRDPLLLPYSEDESACDTGFRLRFELRPGDPAVVGSQPALHGDEIDSNLPLLRCEINPQAHFCVYSVLHDLLVARLDIEVGVFGISDLQIYNQNGQLDPAKPFQPFGPTPSASSYFVFGNYEMAQKRLHQLRLNLDWADLPAGDGGFGEHYAGYPEPMDTASFEVDFSALVDGGWLPAEAAKRGCFKLFESRAENNGVAARRRLAIDEMDFDRAVEPLPPAADFLYNLKSGGGFYRLSLVNPRNAFGHADYTRLLTSVLTANAKKRKPDPVPNPPYTPTLNGLSLDYRAHTSLEPAVDRGARTRLFHLHPFGSESVYPPMPEQVSLLLPKYSWRGNLFIGLRGSDIAGPLSLLFHLAQDRVDPAKAGRARFRWFYLAADRWLPLPEKNILANTTHDFLASGKVTIDVPPDITRGNRIMPPDCYWLRLAVNSAAEAFPACYFIKPHAIRVSRETDSAMTPNQGDAGARPNQWSLLQGRGGIDSISQAYPAFGGRPVESDASFRIRISERLRHKNRALVPRDYEQLTLERFPDIARVKCFNSLSWAHEATRPGRVLVVVVPRVDDAETETCRQAKVDPRRLDEIKDYLDGLSPQFVEPEVINPVYEKIQVRCKVRFADPLSEGVNLNRLNRQISDYLCPWKAPGYEARFGWSIRQRDLESYILGLDHIDFVTDFSLLHVTVDREGKYRLGDTARDDTVGEARIEPRYPWSLAIPMRQHALETTQRIKPEKANITGVDELEVGATFIIGNGEHDEAE